MSLDNFARSCGITELSKTVYPYEKWLCPKEIARCKEFPPYTDFKSSLNSVENEEILHEFIEIVNHRLMLGEWQTVQ